MDRFWLSGAVEDEHIAALQGQGSDKQFVIYNNTLYGINEANQLWSYQLNDERFAILGTVPAHVDNITDVNDAYVLMTLRVKAKKEVVELLLSN